MKQFFLTLFIFSAGICSAQSIDTIVVHKDPRIDVLAEKQIAINKVASKMSSNGLFRGYRLQVLNTRSRDDAFKTKAMLLENFPDEKVYVLYQSPYFKVRIGNFITRSDADDFKNQLSAYYSQPAYVIEDLIEYIPKADDFQ
jgi:hypothetical protein